LLTWKAIAFSINLDTNVRLKQVCNCLEYCKCFIFLFNGFARAAFMDLLKQPRDNDLLTIFVIELIRTSRQSFTSHVGIGSTAQKALDDIFSNCLISVSIKRSNVSIMDMQDSSTNGLPCGRVLEWSPLCIFNIFDRRKY